MTQLTVRNQEVMLTTRHFKLLNLLNNLFQITNTFLTKVSQSPRFMVITRHGYQIFNSVISSNPIKVMNYPTIRQWFAVHLFPNYNVFLSISSTRLQNPYVTSNFFNSTTFPTRTIFTASIFPRALITQFIVFKLGFSTFRTRFVDSLLSSLFLTLNRAIFHTIKNFTVSNLTPSSKLTTTNKTFSNSHICIITHMLA